MEHNSAQNQPESQTDIKPDQVQQPQVVQQYVVQEKSLRGIGGALVFWMIVFALYAVGSITMFTNALVSSADDTATKVVTLLFTPFLATAFIAAVVLIALQKKIAVLVTFAALGLAAVYGTINSITTFTSGNRDNNEAIPTLVAGILISYIILGLVALYFVVSKRVKQTLIK
jgi:uncharacterized membrane protein YuzA (DUF378 family)